MTLIRAKFSKLLKPNKKKKKKRRKKKNAK